MFGSDYIMERNNVIMFSGNMPDGPFSSTNCGIRVGYSNYYIAAGNHFFSGDIAEIIYYNRKLSIGEVQQVNDYLKYKYFITAYGAPIFMLGAQSPTGVQYNYVNMSVMAAPSVSSGISLFASGLGTINNNTTLYTMASTPASGNFNLVTIGNSGINNNFNFFEAGKDSGNNTFTMYTGSAGTSSGNVTLYTSGKGSSSGSINMIVQSQISSGNIPLYLCSWNPASGLFTMYTRAGVADAKFTATTWGSQAIHSGLSFYTAAWSTGDNHFTFMTNAADSKVSPLTMMVQQNPNPSGFNSTTLFLPAYSSGLNTSQMYDTVNMFTYSAFTKSMNMFVMAPSSARLTQGMNLYIVANPSGASNTLSMFVGNTVESGFKSTKMFVRGDGTLNNGLVYNKNMNMYINRPNDGGFNMFMKGNTPNSGVNFYMFGVLSSATGVNLSMTGGPYYGSGHLNLYMPGPSGLVKVGPTLYTKGIPHSSTGVNLYTHGF
jgi:hypothetical protein